MDCFSMPIRHGPARIVQGPTIRHRWIAADSLSGYGYPILAGKSQPELRRSRAAIGCG
jgi:hypothetical protein